MDWKGKKVLVTGCSGVIGRHLVKFLMERKALVRGIDIANFPYKADPLCFDFLQKDILHLNPLDILGFNPEIVFHLAAAFERAVERVEFWKNNYLNNLLASHAIADAFTYSDSVSKYIFASSYLVYDPGLYISKSKNRQVTSLRESSPKKPRNLTGAAKYYAEQEIEFFAENLKRKVQFVHGRIFRVYGQGSKDVISRWVRSGLNKEKIEVFNKENSFDYIDSRDVAMALVKLAESDHSGAVNIGTGKSTQINDAVCALRALFPDLKVDSKGALIEFERTKADIALLKKITGWSPEISIIEGIDNIYEYEKQIKKNRS